MGNKGAAATHQIFIEAALALMDSHGNTAADVGEVICIIRAQLIQSMTALMDHGIHGIGQVFFVIVGGDAHIFVVKIGGSSYIALFFIESICNLIGFGLLSNVYFNQVSNGYATSLYLIYYGVIRTILEPLRNPAYILMWNSIRVSRVMSGLMIVVGLIIYISVSIRITTKKKVRKNG